MHQIFFRKRTNKKVFGLDLGWIDKQKMKRDSEKIIDNLGANVPSVNYISGLLSGGQQQTVAIARALTFLQN